MRRWPAILVFGMFITVLAGANPPANTCGTLDADFTLTANPAAAAATCFTIGANDITLDCGGYTVTYRASSNGYGVYNNGYDNVTIKNCKTTQSTAGAATTHGIYLTNGAENNTIVNNTNISSSTGYAIMIEGSSHGTTIENNIVFGLTDDAIQISASQNTFLYNNTVFGGNGIGDYGIYLLSGSHNATVFWNNVTSFDSALIISSTNYVNATNNTLGMTYDSNGAYATLYLTSSANNNVSGNWIISNAAQGIYLYGSSNNNFTYNNITCGDNDVNDFGIDLETTSNNNNFSFNNLSAYYYAIRLNNDINYNNFFYNNITSRGAYPVYASTTVTNNWFDNNIMFASTAAMLGIYLLTGVSNNNFTNNNITSTGTVVQIQDNSNNNFFQNNNLTSRTNGWGIYLFNTVSNNVFDNNWVRTGNTGALDGLRMNNLATYNNFTNNRVYAIGGYGAYLLTYSSNNYFSNNTINTTGVGGYYGVLITADSNDNQLLNNTIEGGAYGIGITTSSYRTLVDRNNVTARTTQGIVISSSDYTNVTNNTVFAYTAAIVLLSASYSQINYNLVNSTTNYGFSLSATSNNNNFSFNNVTSWSIAAYLASSDNNNFDHNLLNGTNSYGIQLTTSNNNNFTYNNVTAAGGGAAVYMTTSSGNRVNNNNLTGYLAYGIYLTTSVTNNQFDNNNISSWNTAAYYGIFLVTNANNNNFTNTNITTVGGYGAYLTGSSSNIFENITIYSNNSWGVGIYATSKNNIFRNVTAEATRWPAGYTGYALYITASSLNRFYNFVGRSSAARSLYLDSGGSSNIFENCTFNANASQGAYIVTSSNNNTFNFTNFFSNYSQGVYISTTSTTNVFDYCSLYSNASQALYLDGGANNNTFRNTRMQSNFSYATYLITSASYNKFYNATMIANSPLANIYALCFMTNIDNNQVFSSYISSANSYDVYLTGDADDTFIDTSYGDILFGDTLSSLNVSWYFRVNVQDPVGGAVENANITVNGTSGSAVYSGLSNVNGRSGLLTLTEYVRYSLTNITYYTPYAFSALTGEVYNQSTTTLTNSTNATLVLNSSYCGQLSGSITLKNNLYSAGTCFNVTAENATLNCNGYTVNYSRLGFGYGINNTGYSGLVVQSCYFGEGANASNNSAALYFNNARNNTIRNITVNTSRGFSVYSASNSQNTLLSSFFNSTRLFFLDTASHLNKSWYLNLTVRANADNAPIEGATLNITSTSGSLLFYTGQTSGQGEVTMLVLTETKYANATNTLFRDYFVNASRGSVTGGTLVNMTTDRNTSLSINTSVCGYLNGTVTLRNDLLVDGTCFKVDANNSVLDCAGYTINYSRSALGFGINLSGISNFTMKNCTLLQGGSTAGSHALFFAYAGNHSIINSTISTNAGSFNAYFNRSGDNIFLNDSFDNSSVFFEDTDSNMTTEYFLTVRVLGLAGETVASAPATIQEVDGTAWGTGTTGASGTWRTTARSYLKSNTSTTFYTPHNASATHPETLVPNYTVFNFNQSSNVTVGVISASINITAPAQNQIFFQGDTIQILVNETKGTAWINNVTVTVTGDDIDGTYQATETSPGSNLWEYDYSVDPAMSARSINILAKGYNGIVFVQANTSVIVTRTMGAGVAMPVITYLCGNHTYLLQNENTTINVTADLDTIIYSMNVTVKYPNSTSVRLQSINSSSNTTTYVYSYLYQLNATQTGTYMLNATVRDVNNQIVSLISYLYAVGSAQTVNLTTNGGTGIVLADVCSGVIIESGESINKSIVPGNYTVFVNTTYPQITLRNAVINNTVTNALNFSVPDMAAVPAPVNRRTIILFDLRNGSIAYNNSEIYYNYTFYAGTLVAEASLEFDRCTNTGSCVWSSTNSTINATTHAITTSPTVLDGLWGLFEPSYPRPQNVSDPLVYYFCNNRTNMLAGENAVINLTVDFNTTVSSVNLTVTYPNGTAVNLLPNTTQANTTYSTYSYLYIFNATDSGAYTVNISARDRYELGVNRTIRFYAAAVLQTIGITTNGAVTNVSINDQCSGETIASGITGISGSTVPGNYTLFVNTTGPNIAFNNAVVNNTTTLVLNYSTPSLTYVSAPTNRRKIVLFQMNNGSGFSYATVDFNYNYSVHAQFLVAEASLEIQKCLNPSSCSWIPLTTTLNTTTNIISASSNVVDGLWGLLEPAFIQPQNAPFPQIITLCSNHTYKLASEETVINFTTKLNTTAYAINLTITYPNGTTANILPNETSTDNANHIYYNIYRISTPDAGTYTLNGTAADTYYQARSSTNRFYVRSSPTTYSLTSEGAANMSLADVCSGATIAVGATSINTDLPAGNYTLFVNTSNQSFSFNEMSSSNGVALNYTPLAAGTMTPPFNRTALVGFNALSSLNYSRAVIFYNYTAVNSSITSEASLEIYRCNNVSNCTWSIVDSTVNTSEKTITAETSSLDGGWVLFQPAKSVIQTVTRTETGTTYVPTEVNVPYKVVENQTVEVERLISARLIKLPEEVEMYINESKDVPVEIVNPHKVELKGIRIEVDSGNKNLKARLNLTYIASLKPNQSEFISMNLKSVVNVSGVYTVTTKLGVDSPALSDSAKLTVKVAKYLSTDKLEVKKTLDFATELFNENPACLELTELLKKAAAHIEKGEFDEAKLTLARAINGCNKVISARGISPITGMILKEIDWNTTGVIVIISLASAFTVLLYLRLHKPKKGSQGGEAHGS